MSAPDPRHEIERKAIAAAQDLADRFEQGRITVEAYRGGLDGIYETSSGFLPEDSQALLVALRQAAEPCTRLRRVFMDNNGAVVVVGWKLDDMALSILYLKADRTREVRQFNYADKARPYDRRNLAISETVRALTAKGMVEI